MNKVDIAHYKDRPCIRITSPNMSAKFLYEDGGKLASLSFNGVETLAQRQGAHYLRLFADTSYVKSECSGFDDMFPTIDPCVIGDFSYPDHGQVCRMPFNVELADDSFALSCYADSVNAVFSKTVSAESDSLIIEYSIENKNDFPLPYIWAGHVMLAGEQGAYIETPFSKTTPYTVCFGAPPDNKCTLQGYGENKEYKFYYDKPQAPLFCSVVYPSRKRKISFYFEGGSVKYLGLWFNPGDLNRMYNLAVEPCTAPYDTPTNAEKAGMGSFIEPLSTVRFSLRIDCSEVSI